MADSIHVQLADAITTEFNHSSRGWYNHLTATRTWTPWYKGETAIEELQVAPKVAVVPLTLENEWLARNRHKWDYGVAIDVQRMFDLTLEDAVKEQMDLLDSQCQDVQDFFNDAHEITGMAGYISLKADRPDVFNLELLHAQGLWETLITIGIRGHR